MVTEDGTRPMAEDNLPYISEYSDDILSGYRTLVRSPVGSGKTRLALHDLPLIGRTLFITSRITTARQSMNEIVHYDGSSYHVACLGYETDETRLVITTQWKARTVFEQNLFIFTHFDFIVIDEIHFLLSDSFADAPYYINELLRFIPDDCKVIGFSACAEYLRDNGYLTEWRWLDYTGLVRSSKPKTITKVRKPAEYDEILAKSTSDSRAIVFRQTVEDANELADALNARHIPSIAISSKPADGELPEDQKLAYQYICEYSVLPDNIHVLVATSRLREGVNICDSRVKVVINELTDYVSLVQCAGRVRVGEYDYIIVWDTADPNIDRRFEEKLAVAKKHERSLEAVADFLVLQNLTFINDESVRGHEPPHLDQNIRHILKGIDPDLKKIMILDSFEAYPRWKVYMQSVIQNRIRQADHDLLKQDPDGYLESVLHIRVQDYKVMIAWRLLEHLVDQEINVTNDMRLRLIAQFAAFGIVGRGPGGKKSTQSKTSFKPLLNGVGIYLHNIQGAFYLKSEPEVTHSPNQENS